MLPQSFKSIFILSDAAFFETEIFASEFLGTYFPPTIWPIVGPLTGRFLPLTLLHPILCLTAYLSLFTPYTTTTVFFGRSTLRISLGIGMLNLRNVYSLIISYNQTIYNKNFEHFVDILRKILGITRIFGTGILPSAEAFFDDKQDLSGFDQKNTAIKGGYIVLQNWESSIEM